MTYKEAYDNASHEDKLSVDLLEMMRGVYPGDPDHAILRDICEILDIPFVAPEIKVTYG